MRPPVMSPISSPPTPASIPLATPARNTGRWAEAGLLVIALLLGLSGFLLTAINRTGSSPGQFLLLAGCLVVAAVVVHLWVRRTAPWADPVILPAAVALNGLGLAMIQRLDMAYKILERTHNYAAKQAMWTGVGIVLFCAMLLVRDYRLLRRWDRWAMWAGLAFLILPFVPGLGQSINGARIWIRLGPMSFQPAEMTKVLLAIFFASFLVANRDNLALAGRRIMGINLPRARHLGPLLVVWGVSIVVLVLQRDLGSSLLLFGLFVVTLYVATDRPSWLLLGAALFIPAAWFAATHLSHVQQRVSGWLHAMDPAIYGAEYGGSQQLVTGLFGMASGGLMGTGWGKGYPNLVPFANSDFIIASFGEELGLMGMLALLMLYLILIERGLRTAAHLRDGFGKLLAVSLSFAIALQVFVVVGGVTRLIPLTGLTTPFLAYGGSSLVANWIILALLVRLSDAARRPVTAAPRIIDTAELPTSIRRAVLNADTPDEANPRSSSAPPDQPTAALDQHPAAPAAPPDQYAPPPSAPGPHTAPPDQRTVALDQHPGAPAAPPDQYAPPPSAPNPHTAPAAPPDRHSAPPAQYAAAPAASPDQYAPPPSAPGPHAAPAAPPPSQPTAALDQHPAAPDQYPSAQVPPSWSPAPSAHSAPPAPPTRFTNPPTRFTEGGRA